MLQRLFLVLTLLTASPIHAAELKIATWNLNWLATNAAGLPPNVKPRQPADFLLLRGYAIELNADLIAIQEIDNREAAHRVFPPEIWAVHLSRDRIRQRVGIAVRRGISYDVNDDVTALAIDSVARLRSGVDITLRLPGTSIRVLAVHLKSGCQYASFGREPRSACLTLIEQRDAIAVWTAARRDEGVPFLILGDFNRGMEKRDPFIKAIRAVAPLTRATEGYASPCWGQETFIDHILIGGEARSWILPNSLRVLTYREADPSWKDRLSDHCPVSVRLSVPD